MALTHNSLHAVCGILMGNLNWKFLDDPSNWAKNKKNFIKLIIDK